MREELHRQSCFYVVHSILGQSRLGNNVRGSRSTVNVVGMTESIEKQRRSSIKSETSAVNIISFFRKQGLYTSISKTNGKIHQATFSQNILIPELQTQ